MGTRRRNANKNKANQLGSYGIKYAVTDKSLSRPTSSETDAGNLDKYTHGTTAAGGGSDWRTISGSATEPTGLSAESEFTSLGPHVSAEQLADLDKLLHEGAFSPERTEVGQSRMDRITASNVLWNQLGIVQQNYQDALNARVNAATPEEKAAAASNLQKAIEERRNMMQQIKTLPGFADTTWGTLQDLDKAGSADWYGLAGTGGSTSASGASDQFRYDPLSSATGLGSAASAEATTPIVDRDIEKVEPGQAGGTDTGSGRGILTADQIQGILDKYKDVPAGNIQLTPEEKAAIESTIRHFHESAGGAGGGTGTLGGTGTGTGTPAVGGTPGGVDVPPTGEPAAVQTEIDPLANYPTEAQALIRLYLSGLPDEASRQAAMLRFFSAPAPIKNPEVGEHRDPDPIRRLIPYQGHFGSTIAGGFRPWAS